jgi:hypothetical protein
MSTILPHKITSLKVNLDMAEATMYGYLGELAKKLGGYIGHGYNGLTTVAAGRYGMQMHTQTRTRAQEYTLLFGAVGTGKSLTVDKACESLNPKEINIERRPAGSEIGLLRFFEREVEEGADPTPESVLLLSDEWAAQARKIQIGGSALDATLRAMWNKDFGGSGSKEVNIKVFVRLNILGCAPVVAPSEFRDLFGSQTQTGLADRFIIVPAPSTNPELDYHSLAPNGIREPTDIAFPKAMQNIIKLWHQATPATEKSRRRLQEIVSRKCVIAGAMSRDKSVTRECVDACLAWGEWQEQVRELFQPSQSLNVDGQIWEDLLEAMLIASSNEPTFIKFQDLNRQKNWSRKFGQGRMVATRDSAVRMGDLIPHLDEEGRATGKYRLAENFFKRRVKATQIATAGPESAGPALIEAGDEDYLEDEEG